MEWKIQLYEPHKLIKIVQFFEWFDKSAFEGKIILTRPETDVEILLHLTMRQQDFPIKILTFWLYVWHGAKELKICYACMLAINCKVHGDQLVVIGLSRKIVH